jgi:hypothetical protein
MQDDELKEVEEYAGLHHATQAFAYYMGYRYHTRRKRTAYRIICVVGIAFHTWSALKHFKD